MNQRTWEHGTRKGYRENACRCDTCRAWNRDTARAYQERRKSGEFPMLTCTAESCARGAVARGMCKMHYARWARANDMGNCPSDAWSEGRRSNSHARRARLNGARNGDRALLSQVIARDGLDCAWCGEPVDLTIEWPDRMSKSLDHTQPLSKGGTHSLSNARLMHFKCNSSKGNRVA